jgi:hypothetical protein
MRSLWRLRRVRLYVYAAVGCVAAIAAGGIYAAVHVALAEPVPVPARELAPPRHAGLSAVATSVVGQDVQVVCWSGREWRRYEAEAGPSAGFVSEDREGPSVNLASETCGDLLGAGEVTTSREDRAWAVSVLAHELQHARGIDDEAVAECYAYQWMPTVAAALAVKPEEGRRLARLAWRRFYPPDDPAYFSRECRDGGALDLEPRSSDWP